MTLFRFLFLLSNFYVRTNASSWTFYSHGKGPFLIELYLKFGATDDKGYMMIEVPSLKDLPHSVSTFIDMVEAKVYDNTMIVGKNGKLQIETLPSNPDALQLGNVKRVLGFSDNAVLFNEQSHKYPCKPNWIGYVDLGPTIEIYASDKSNDSSISCFGQVIQGLKFVELTRAATNKGQSVELVMAKLLQPSKKKSGGGRDEL